MFSKESKQHRQQGGTVKSIKGNNNNIDNSVNDNSFNINNTAQGTNVQGIAGINNNHNNISIKIDNNSDAQLKVYEIKLDNFNNKLKLYQTMLKKIIRTESNHNLHNVEKKFTKIMEFHGEVSTEYHKVKQINNNNIYKQNLKKFCELSIAYYNIALKMKPEIKSYKDSKEYWEKELNDYT